ncbi:L-serine dehydratase 1 [Gluconacetobacter diazotrophicus PA1 5]|uniref:L-serine dehydratase n=2 Tax=Gluconacetobacter diazotrophicus TaxID=33996 RepID=A9HG23_GLUDA|nr:L-serine ammonia-lyase [Gluconacetobacter diazotrophicus]ACI51952.1 L-serine dehydratase 1 [Gluconacetobacter diazotrophicus PA1 5]MBB2157123.1 L-serine ammonia-lyase [Gluconacetobacter diazotrophicus]TWB05143.1 L-serine dehydratase [Gluconacetobacter diazotrophicus]CAP55440.1 putative L-serine deaminase /L-threonine deaminase [Gluconacetobacter diazotrophicus PA1 5]
MISLFDLFRIGIGPSSSHTVGPMRAARRFATHLPPAMPVARLRVTLYGSLAWTASGHATDKAVILGLAGETPEGIDPDAAGDIVRRIGAARTVLLHGRAVAFDPARDIVLDRDTIPPVHPNTLQFQALAADGTPLETGRFCSVGGGFIVPEDATKHAGYAQPAMPLDFASGVELLDRTRQSGLGIAGVVLANETALRPPAEITAYLDRIIDTMMTCVERGLVQRGTLPGRIKVPRRAAALHERLLERTRLNQRPPHEAMDWISLFAIAVNEENAAGGRVVTAPTNGAAGVIPAVLRYYRDFCPGASRAGMHDFLLTAAAVGGLFKLNASISGAEVGCQGEVGVASSMAAAGLAAALGATPLQIENAAEIGMEHHLGMTCDPVAGLVQIPCIERNAFGAVKAVNAASLAMHGDGAHQVSLDQVIRTMAETGRDMNHRYKETALGGLAVNFPEC